jgi:hypothetical protein
LTVIAERSVQHRSARHPVLAEGASIAITTSWLNRMGLAGSSVRVTFNHFLKTKRAKKLLVDDFETYFDSIASIPDEEPSVALQQLRRFSFGGEERIGGGGHPCECDKRCAIV